MDQKIRCTIVLNFTLQPKIRVSLQTPVESMKEKIASAWFACGAEYTPSVLDREFGGRKIPDFRRPD